MDKENKASGCYTDSMKGISTDRFSLEYFITNDLLYVDKTMYAYEFVRSAEENFFFLSRPRRFGKSLFCSTLHAVFEGRKDLFKGLYIAEKTDYSFEKYPVLHFNFANLSKLSAEDFIGSMQDMIIAEAANAAGITDLDRASPARMLWDVLPRIAEKTGKGAVIIIDEYDDPLTKAILGGFSYTEEMRLVLNDFFSVIKNSSAYIRFFFMTGCIRLSNLSIFSAMNNLKDISMDPRFAGAFGYTEEEVEEFFGEGIDENWERCGYGTREEFFGAIKDYYDGYRFSPRSDIKVYNPVSLGSFFSDGCIFDNYWEKTGLTLLAVQAVSKYGISLFSDIEDNSEEITVEAAVSAFTNFSLTRLNDKKAGKDAVFALLYYSGYLTLIRQDVRTYILGFPNIEVHATFIGSLISEHTGDENYMDVWISHFHKACAAGNVEKVMNEIDIYLQGFQYDVVSKWDEAAFQGVFHSIFEFNSMLISSEVRGLIGRSDEVLIAGNHIWIFELKINRKAEEALEQIKRNRYEGKYLDYSRAHRMEIHLIGISLNTKTRKLSWLAE